MHRDVQYAGNAGAIASDYGSFGVFGLSNELLSLIVF